MRIVFADVATLADQLAALGATRVLVLASSARHVAAVTTALARFTPTVFEGARVHVPAEVVDAVTAVLASSGADTIVAIGGGSPIGLGKALRLTHAVRFVVVPTTYAGSEMTTMFGITRGRDKQTGRDPRVRPDLVLYDVALTTTMPRVLTVQSLCNAIAHVVSVLSTHSLADVDRAAAYMGVADVLAALAVLADDPADLGARERALRGASACAAALDRGKAGVQHAFAHLLGGAFGVDHAPLHAILLPRFLAHLRAEDPSVVDALEAAVGQPALADHLLALLARADAPTTLSALGIDEAALTSVLASRPELPGHVVRAAFA